MLVHGRGVADRLCDATIPAAGKATDVAGVMDGARAGLSCQLGNLDLRATPANDEAGAARPQRPVEVGQTLEHELRARSRGVAAVEQSVVEAEDRDQVVGALASGLEGRVVVDAQVASQPQKRRHTGSHGSASCQHVATRLPKAKVRVSRPDENSCR